MSEETPSAEDGGLQRLPVSLPPRLPSHAALTAEESIACHCAKCGRSWSVHRDLAGYRVRCECGEFIAVNVSLSVPRESALDLVSHSNELDMSVPRSEGLFAPSTAPREVALGSALEPDALADAKNEVRTQWTSRTILELVLLMTAFLAPQ